ncbi:MAG: hypothetical protein FJ152_07595 [Firmicutes bacterium]|nr:hypothetical protein [Bacillota bacterium]
MSGSLVKEKRILVVVNCLAEHGDSRFRRLYEFIELAGVDLARRFLSAHYREISALRDKEVTWPAFLERLQKISSRQGIEAVDLFFQLHGERGRVRFFDRWVSAIELGREIKKITADGRLRLVYNLCCYGDSHSAAFLTAGFETAIGALKVNTSAAVEYPLFCKLWPGTGSTPKTPLPINEVLRRADRPLPRLVQDLIARRYFGDADSKKTLKGNSTLTI